MKKNRDEQIVVYKYEYKLQGKPCTVMLYSPQDAQEFQEYYLNKYDIVAKFSYFYIWR